MYHYNKVYPVEVIDETPVIRCFTSQEGKAGCTYLYHTSHNFVILITYAFSLEQMLAQPFPESPPYEQRGKDGRALSDRH